MRTIDTNPEASLALVQDGADWHSGDNATRYCPLADAPPLDAEAIPQTYLGQLHYVAGHIIDGLLVHTRMDANGNRPPKAGWTRWKNYGRG
jgi:hypothetical protein